MHDAEYVLDDQRVLEHLQVARQRIERLLLVGELALVLMLFTNLNRLDGDNRAAQCVSEAGPAAPLGLRDANANRPLCYRPIHMDCPSCTRADPYGCPAARASRPRLDVRLPREGTTPPSRPALPMAGNPDDTQPTAPPVYTIRRGRTRFEPRHHHEVDYPYE